MLAEIAEIPADAALDRKDDMRKRGLASPDDGDALALTFAYPVAKRDWAAPVKALRGEEYELSGVGAFTYA
jgi:hypothetical protein